MTTTETTTETTAGGDEHGPGGRAATAVSAFVAATAVRVGHAPLAPVTEGERAAFAAMRAAFADLHQAGDDRGYRRAFDGITRPGGLYARLFDALEAAWGLIANAGGGDWDRETVAWREAAARWREEQYHRLLDERARRVIVPPAAAADRERVLQRRIGAEAALMHVYAWPGLDLWTRPEWRGDLTIAADLFPLPEDDCP